MIKTIKLNYLILAYFIDTKKEEGKKVCQGKIARRTIHNYGEQRGLTVYINQADRYAFAGAFEPAGP